MRKSTFAKKTSFLNPSSMFKLDDVPDFNDAGKV